jgi:hypothetical protein
MNPKNPDAIEKLAESFVTAIKNGAVEQDGWSNSMYGVSKVAEISYTRWLANDLENQVGRKGAVH